MILAVKLVTENCRNTNGGDIEKGSKRSIGIPSAPREEGDLQIEVKTLVTTSHRTAIRCDKASSAAGCH